MISRLLFLFLILAALTLPISRAVAQTQAEMNREAYADFKKADVELNKVYQQVLSKMDEEGQGKLKAAQRAWVAFRDAQAEVDADVNRGGTMAPLTRATAMTSATIIRTKQLRDSLKELNVH